MHEFPQLYERMREKRQRYGRYALICLVIIIGGFLSMLAFTAWKIILIILLVPTAFGGYSAGVFARNWAKEQMMLGGKPPEDAELGSIIAGVCGGLLGTASLATLQYSLLMILRHAGQIV